MTEYERIVEHGRELGLEEGLKRGREEARLIKRVFVEQLLTLRFGPLDEADHALLAALSIEQVETARARLVDPDFQPDGTVAGFLETLP